MGADDESYEIFEKKLEILELGNNESYEDMLRIEEDPESLHENEILDGDTIVKAPHAAKLIIELLTAQDPSKTPVVMDPEIFGERLGASKKP